MIDELNKELGGSVKIAWVSPESKFIMNCPNCGSSILSEQQFCRACGKGLKAYGPRPAGRSVLPGLFMAFGGIVIALFGKMVFHLDIMVLIGVLMSITGMFYTAAYPYLPRALKLKADSESTSDSSSILSSGSTNKLPPMDISDTVPSITEHTTNLLKVPSVRE